MKKRKDFQKLIKEMDQKDSSLRNRLNDFLNYQRLIREYQIESGGDSRLSDYFLYGANYLVK